MTESPAPDGDGPDRARPNREAPDASHGPGPGGGSQEPPPGASSGDQPGRLATLLADAALLDELARARADDLIGPGAVERQLAHSLGFAEPLPATGITCVDLGAGGGLPGLVLARARPGWTLVLVDATAKRCRSLQAAVDRLGVGDRVEVVHARAEDLGRGARRTGAEAVVARSFGPPAVVAECAAPLLVVGGHLVVSEPPTPGDRWPAEGLAQLGMAVGVRYRATFGYQVLVQRHACPDRFPRRAGIPAKRPLF